MSHHLRSFIARFRGLFANRSADKELNEEIKVHIDLLAERYVNQGMSRAEAISAARRQFGNITLLQEENRDMRGFRSIETIIQDLRYGMRGLYKNPGFTIAAVLTLALGIGANSAIFTLVDATLLRPLPLPEPDRLVMIWESSDKSNQQRVSPLNLIDWNIRNSTFDRIAGFIPSVGSMVMNSPGGRSENVSRQSVTCSFFDVLGVKPVVGRTCQQSDENNNSRIVILNEAFWQARFNSDHDVIGRHIQLDGESYTVVGVIPKESQLFGRTDIWAPFSMQGAPPAARGRYFLQGIGRLKHGVKLDGADADMKSVAVGLAQEFPDTNKGRSTTIKLMHDALIGSDLRLTSMIFLGVVSFVLLICTSNVAKLLLARGMTRSREIAVCSSLGANRIRIIRQLLTESLLLSVIGGLFGLVIGIAILKIAPLVIPEGLLPPAVTLTFNWRLVLFCFMTAVAVGILFGVAPAWQGAKLSTAQVINANSRTTTGRGGKLQAILVIGEVATAVILLFGAGLLLRTLMVVTSVDRGYQAEDVLTMIVDPLGSQYPDDASLLQFYEAVEQEVSAVPGVRSMGWASTLPLGPSYAGQFFFDVVGEVSGENRFQAADYQIVNPSYFRTVDLPVFSGRSFNERDRPGSVPVCMVNEAFVRNNLSGRTPIGLRVTIRQRASAQSPSEIREIVGVVRQVKGQPDEIDDFVQIYVPLAQSLGGDMFMVVRPVSGRAEALASSVRAAINRIDKKQLVGVRSVMTLNDVVWEVTARHRFRAILVGIFAVLALVLAMVGIFGILGYSVQQRRRDWGIRMALGATTRDILGLVLRNASRMIITGVVIGLSVSTLVSRGLTKVLFGVEPLDPVTFASVTSLVVITAVISIAGPALRAIRIDPATVLREE